LQTNSCVGVDKKLKQTANPTLALQSQSIATVWGNQPSNGSLTEQLSLQV